MASFLLKTYLGLDPSLHDVTRLFNESAAAAETPDTFYTIVAKYQNMKSGSLHPNVSSHQHIEA